MNLHAQTHDDEPESEENDVEEALFDAIEDDDEVEGDDLLEDELAEGLPPPIPEIKDEEKEDELAEDEHLLEEDAEEVDFDSFDDEDDL